MKIVLLVLLFLGAFAVHGHEGEESKELDTDFEAEDANDENELDAEVAEEIAAETDADPNPLGVGPGICTGCSLCDKLYKMKKEKGTTKYDALIAVSCGRCKGCSYKTWKKIAARIVRKIPVRKIVRKITDWGRRRRSWSRRRRRRRRRRSRRRRRRRRRRRW